MGQFTEETRAEGEGIKYSHSEPHLRERKAHLRTIGQLRSVMRAVLKLYDVGGRLVKVRDAYE